MSNHHRVYFVTAEGLRRAQLYYNRRRYPSLAGQERVKLIEVGYEFRGAELWWSVRGLYVGFDSEGQYRLDLVSFRDHPGITPDELRAKPVPNIESIRKAEQRLADFEARRAARFWEPDADQLAAIQNDVLGSARPKGTKAILRMQSAPLADAHEILPNGDV